MAFKAYWHSIIYANGKFVAIANNYNKAAYSTNGTTWVSTNMPSYSAWSAVAYGDGKFVVLGSEKKVAYSTDGITWVGSSTLLPYAFRTIAYGNGKFVVIGSGDKVAYSTNLSSWTTLVFYQKVLDSSRMVCCYYNETCKPL